MNKTVKDLLPQNTRWSQNALAKHICADRKTIKIYAETLAFELIADYRMESPRNPDGTPVSGMQLSPYQAWVVIQLVRLGREIRESVNGLKIHTIIRASVRKNPSLLSRKAWESLEKDAA